ncbi:hypothetical protein AB0945_05815 [Streptomyces sp. NPDC005474]|uniref:hypothetical protein n=1 Tax=Streptomyces sp. NPDC005474 TaxID=3154878 RepID=UPI003455B783
MPPWRGCASCGTRWPVDFNIAFIKELPLACLEGEGTRRGSAVSCRTTPDDVINELFAAAQRTTVG